MSSTVSFVTNALLLAQTGGAKSAIGWLIVLLCIALGLLVVCRPSGREKAETRRK
jgi:hypothetical protein